MDKVRCENELELAVNAVQELVWGIMNENDELLEECDKLKAKNESLFEEREELKAKNEEVRLVVEKHERLNENRESERRWEAAVKTSGMWQEAQKRGMKRAWELARKIVHLDWNGAVCGPNTVEAWFDSMTVEDAQDAMERWEKLKCNGAHWVGDFERNRYLCSECGMPSEVMTRFCPHCGALLVKESGCD